MSFIQPIGEAIDNGFCRAFSSAEWKPIHHILADGVALRNYTVGRPLILHCPAETTELHFLRHEWSGRVIVTAGGESQTIDLAHSGAEIVTARLPVATDRFEVIVEGVLVEGRDTAHSEVWLLGVTFIETPLAMGRSVQLNTGTKLLYGEWGEFLALSSDEVIPNAIARFGSWAPEDIKVFKEHVPEGGVVLDVGANIGHHSVVFSKLVGQSGSVIAIEAQRLMYQLLNANLILNRCVNTVPILAAAGANRGTVNMYPISYDETGGNFGALAINSTDAHRGEGEVVQCYTLDELLPDYLDNRKVDFVKIDVQSYELFVLQGMVNILDRDKPTIFVEISPYWMGIAGYKFSEIYTLLRGLGYDLIHREGTVLTEEGIPDVAPDTQNEWDVLAVHPNR